MKIVSLFSGAGGLDLGLSLAGNEIMWANDFDSDAVSTYKKNIGNHIRHGDIKDISISDIPDPDVVVGGFPCQGFSQANLLRSTGDSRNKLYIYFLKVVKKTHPRYFIAENVRGLLSIGGGAIIKKIISDFQKIGYVVSVHLVNMADYGIPQTRQRVIIIGQKKDIGAKSIFIFPIKTHGKNGVPLPWVSIKSAIGHYPDPEKKSDYLNHVCSSYKIEYRNFTGHRETNPDKPSPTILARGNGKGGVCAIPHYNGQRRLSIRESATIQTFPEDFEFIGQLNSCYRQIGNAVPVQFATLLGRELIRLEKACL